MMPNRKLSSFYGGSKESSRIMSSNLLCEHETLKLQMNVRGASVWHLDNFPYCTSDTGHMMYNCSLIKLFTVLESPIK